MRLAKDVMYRMEDESFQFEHLAIDGRIAI